MGAPDRWLSVRVSDGRFTVHEENDGWTFLNRGPERVSTVVTLHQLMQEHPDMYDRYQRGVFVRENE